MSLFSKSASTDLVFTAAAATQKPKSAANTVTFTPTAVGGGDREVVAATRVSFGLTADSVVLAPGAVGSLRTVLRSGLSTHYPVNFAETSDGVVLITNGVDPMLRWDGSSRPAEVAGVSPPDAALTIAVEGTGTPGGTVYGYVRFVDRYGNPSDLSPVSAGVGGFAVVTRTTYTAVPVPTGLYALKAFKRQLLRNTVGQADVFYVDVETLDLTSSAFTSANSDTDLQGNEAVPILDDLGRISANTHGFPPSDRSVTAAHLGRMFAAGEVTYRDGHVELTSGSAEVRGVGTDWPASFANRSLFVANAPKAYGVLSVDAEAQVLTLAEPYLGVTDLFSFYAIQPALGDRRLVYYTPPGQAESWPPTFALQVQEDGDEITGLMTLGSFLYILQKRSVYRFTFKDDPATDGAVFLTAKRGCLSQRLWVQAEGTAYMLDEMGVHAFSGGDSVPISAPVQDLFRDDTDSPLRINWTADPTLWSSSYSEVHASVRWFVAMTGSRYPRHALCYNYRDKRWWIEEYKRPVTASTRARLGVVRAVAGFDHREVVALDVGWSDGARDPTGTVRGTVTSASPLSLTDAAASFSAADAVNLAVFLVGGRGKGQWRRVTVRSETRLNVLCPWVTAPDDTTAYVLGGVDYTWRSGWFRVAESEAANDRTVEVVFQPIPAGTADVRSYYDHAPDARVFAATRDGVASTVAGDATVTVDLTSRLGVASFRQDGHQERNADGTQYVSIELAGVQSKDPVRVYRVTANGVSTEG